LNVSAKDQGTGKEQNIRIEASSGLTEEEIKRMRDEAKANEEADQKERDRADKINEADGMIFQTEKQLKEYGDKLPEDKKAPITEALENLKNAHKAQDLPAIDTALEALNKAWHAASEEMYKATQGADGAQQPGFDPGAAGAGDRF